MAIGAVADVSYDRRRIEKNDNNCLVLRCPLLAEKLAKVTESAFT